MEKFFETHTNVVHGIAYNSTIHSNAVIIYATHADFVYRNAFLIMKITLRGFMGFFKKKSS